MASLTRYRADIARINDGEWITVGQDGDEFEIRTRGFTPRYRDALNQLCRQAAREANRRLQPGQLAYTPDALPPTMFDKCQGQALAEHVTLDVRGLTHDGDRPVTGDELRDMLRDPEQFSGLLVLAIGAAARVHADRQSESTEAGNS